LLISVTLIVDLVANGLTATEILRAYPNLEQEYGAEADPLTLCSAGEQVPSLWENAGRFAQVS
jgi:hypothetical protein